MGSGDISSRKSGLIAVFVSILLTIPFLCFAQSFAKPCPLTGKEETAFERIVSRNCGKVPYPIEEIGAGLRVEGHIFSHGDMGDGVDFFRIPYGRSLVREHTNLRRPRYLTQFSYLNQVTGGFLPLLYLGYTPSTAQIEIISWSDLKSRYEFYVVENYHQESGQIVHPDRGTCITCHQNGGPIFSRAPWTEIEGASRLNFALSENTPGAPKASAKPGPLAYDSRVRQSAWALKMFDVCKSICETAQCKSDFMAALISESLKRVSVNLTSPFQTPKDTVYPLHQFFAEHPENRLDSYRGRPSSVIPNRNTDESNESQILNAHIDVLHIPGTQNLDPNIYNEGVLDSSRPLSKSSRIKSENGTEALSLEDPKLPRPLQTLTKTEIVNGAATAVKICYGVWAEQIRSLGLSVEAMVTNLRTSKSAEKFFAHEFPSADRTLRFLSGAEILSPAIAPSPAPGSRETRSPQVVLLETCGACHGSGLNSLGSGGYVLPLDSVSELREYGRRQPGLVLRMIRDRIMPPRESKFSITLKEREQLLKYLEQR